MAGYPWYLKDEPFNRDPYKRQRNEIARLRDSLTTAQREDWDHLKENMEFFDGEVEIELDYLRHFIKVRNS
jgi:hypothetical protein